MRTRSSGRVEAITVREKAEKGTGMNVKKPILSFDLFTLSRKQTINCNISSFLWMVLVVSCCIRKLIKRVKI